MVHNHFLQKELQKEVRCYLKVFDWHEYMHKVELINSNRNGLDMAMRVGFDK